MIVTRFAPSPTGFLHLGHVYSLICSYEYSKNHNGKFILRIEDIDFTRCKNIYTEAIIKDMNWLEIPFFRTKNQSLRKKQYSKALNFLKPNPFSPFGGSKLQNFKIPEIGQLLEEDDQTTFNMPTRTPMFEEFTQLVNPMMPQIQQAGTGFMSPVLGTIRVSPKGNLIITRKLRNQFKALADNVGLVQASNLAGIPLEIGAMILTKRFPQRSKSISTKKMRDCARTYKQITNFYNMIPKRTATRKTTGTRMRGASTVIQNS